MPGRAKRDRQASGTVPDPGLGYAAGMGATTRERAIVELILHELRTPLNVASGSLAQLGDERSGGLSVTQRTHLDRARRACVSLEGVVRQLRDWTEITDAPPAADAPLGATLAEAVHRARAQGGRGSEVPLAIEAYATVAIPPAILS